MKQKASLKEQVAALLEVAKANLLRSDDNQLIPMFITLGDTPTILPLIGVTRELAPSVAKALTASPDTTEIFHVHEAWVAETTPEEFRSDPRSPSQRDNRIEVIFIGAKSRSGEMVLVTQEFNRDDADKALFEKPPVWVTDQQGARCWSRILDGAFT